MGGSCFELSVVEGQTFFNSARSLANQSNDMFSLQLEAARLLFDRYFEHLLRVHSTHTA